MVNTRTLTELRKGLKGRIYIYLEDEKICNVFLKNAEDEGYRFGKIKPTKNDGSNIIALEKNKQLSYVGFVGHMAFQCPDGVKGNFYRIDYKKFINGDKDYLFKDEPKLQVKEIKGKFYESITVIGNNCDTASRYIENNISCCEDIEQEEKLYSDAEKKFNVLVVEE